MGLAPKKARLTPASRAATAASYIGFDQYSSCPTERKPRWFNRRPPFACVSTSVEYVTSYPDISSQRRMLISPSQKISPTPSSAYGRSNETFTALGVPATVFAPALLYS